MVVAQIVVEAGSTSSFHFLLLFELWMMMMMMMMMVTRNWVFALLLLLHDLSDVSTKVMQIRLHYHQYHRDEHPL
jgi:hypothetical protein